MEHWSASRGSISYGNLWQKPAYGWHSWSEKNQEMEFLVDAPRLSFTPWWDATEEKAYKQRAQIEGEFSQVIVLFLPIKRVEKPERARPPGRRIEVCFKRHTKGESLRASLGGMRHPRIRYHLLPACLGEMNRPGNQARAFNVCSFSSKTLNY